MRLVLPIALVLVLASCGGGGDGPTYPSNNNSQNNPPMNNPPSTSSSVVVSDNSFDPITTTVAVGTTVTWTFSGYNTHNVSFDNSTVKSADMSGGTYQRTFNSAGSYPYRCSIHGAAMSGTIVVQ